MPYSHKYMKHIIINQISEGLQQFMNVHIYLMVVCEVLIVSYPRWNTVGYLRATSMRYCY